MVEVRVGGKDIFSEAGERTLTALLAPYPIEMKECSLPSERVGTVWERK